MACCSRWICLGYKSELSDKRKQCYLQKPLVAFGYDQMVNIIVINKLLIRKAGEEKLV